MFPSHCESHDRQPERSLKKRINFATSRISPYPPVLRPLNAFPTQATDVLKTFDDCYDRLRSNRSVVSPTRCPKSPLPNQDGQSISSSVNDRRNADTSKDNNSLSYIGMIATAILNSPGAKLTLAGIYSFMEKHFLSILDARPGWRNTVRHNLSLHDCFVKGEIAAEGKGRFWRIHPNYVEQFKCGKFNKNLLEVAVPMFSRSTTNYHFTTRPDALSAMSSPFWPRSTFPLSSSIIPSPCPFQTLPFYQHCPPTTHLSNQREHSFPFRQYPADCCNTAFTHVRSGPPTLFSCRNYEISPTFQALGTTSSSER